MSKPVQNVILLSRDVKEIPFDLRQFRHIIYNAGTAGLDALVSKLTEAISAISKPVHRIFVDEQGRGRLPERLMGPDHCLYEFGIVGGFSGHRSVKFQLHVVRHIMQKKPRHQVVFQGGMGLRLEERRRISSDLPGWDISYETAPNGKTCFRIFEPDVQPPKSRASKRPAGARA
jgi:hypothetical protein